MPANPKRTKRALQELSRVFNKLASELTADLNEAIREIENLKREIRTLKSRGASMNPTRASGTRRRTSNRSRSRASSPSSSHADSTTPSSTSHQPSHHGTSTPPKEETPYVFPQEPYNPPAPPEPSLPGNN